MTERKKKRRASAIDRQVGANLKTLRSYRGVSMVEAAQILEVSFQQLQKYEKGENRLSAGKLYALRHYLDVPYECFFSGLEMAEEDAVSTIGNDPDMLHVLRRMGECGDEAIKRKIRRIVDVMVS